MSAMVLRAGPLPALVLCVGFARDLALAGVRLREVENPLGKIMVYQYARPGFSFVDWRNLRDDWLAMAANEEATRAALAIRIHEARGGEPPSALDDRVVGADLEGNGYARDRRWEDDDDEDDDGDEASGPFDLVFDVPAVAKDAKSSEDGR